MTKEELQARVDALTAQNARLREALEEIRRTPNRPFPDAGAHSHRAFGMAVWEAWYAIQRRTEKALAQTPTESLEAVRAAAVAELQQALECDRINVIEGVNRLTKEIESRAWLATGARSSYEWDDARYQQEFRDAAEAILEALEPLKKIGADLSNCPADAKRSLERMRAEARLQTLKDIASLVPGIDEGPLDKGSILTRLSGWLDEAVKADLEVIRAEAGHERAVRELEELKECFDARAFHVGGPAERAFMECRDACRSRLEEIAKEGK